MVSFHDSLGPFWSGSCVAVYEGKELISDFINNIFICGVKVKILWVWNYLRVSNYW